MPEFDLPNIEQTMGTVFDKNVPADTGLSKIVDADTGLPMATPTPGVDPRARDDRGRFAKDDTNLDTQQPHKAAANEDQASTETTPVVESVEAPRGWPDALKTRFGELPEDLRKQLADHESKREKSIEQTLSDAGAARQFAEAVDSVVRPYLPFIQSQGGQPLAAVGQLLATAQAMSVDPKGVLLHLARQFNVDLSGAAQGAPPTNPLEHAPQLPPGYAELPQRVNALQQHILATEQSRQQAQRSEAEHAIAAFSGDTKTAPHFNDVRQTMAGLIQNGMASGLKDAYDKACRLHPEVWSKIAAAERTAEAKQLADKARKASAVVTRPNGGGLPVANVSGKRSIEDTLRETYDRLNAN